MYLVTSWIGMALLGVMLVALLFRFSSANYQLRLATRFWRKIGLPFADEQMASAVGRWLRHRASMAIGGALVGLLVCAGALYIDPELGSATFVWVVLGPVMVSGAAVFAVVFSLRYSLFTPDNRVSRLARPRATTVADYVSPWRLRLAPAFIVSAVVLCIGGVALGSLGLIDADAFLGSPALVLLAVAIIVFVVGVAGERRILRHQQPATDKLELAWDDAFRADTFRALRELETFIAWVAVAAAGLGLLRGWDAVAATRWSAGAEAQLLGWGCLATLFLFTFGRAQTYFRYRLWPEYNARDASAATTAN